LQHLGRRLRQLRHQHGLTLAELGSRVDLSASYLSQIERGGMLPSLSTLTSIARTLDVGVAHFFEDERRAPRIVSSGRGKKVDAGSGVGMEILSAIMSDKEIQPCRLVCQPGSRYQQPAATDGEGFCFVLKGELVLTVGEETFVLRTGDGIHFQMLQPHAWQNVSDQECVAIWAVSPPIWGGDGSGENVDERR